MHPSGLSANLLGGQLATHNSHGCATHQTGACTGREHRVAAHSEGQLVALASCCYLHVHRRRKKHALQQTFSPQLVNKRDDVAAKQGKMNTHGQPTSTRDICEHGMQQAALAGWFGLACARARHPQHKTNCLRCRMVPKALTWSAAWGSQPARNMHYCSFDFIVVEQSSKRDTGQHRLWWELFLLQLYCPLLVIPRSLPALVVKHSSEAQGQVAPF